MKIVLLETKTPKVGEAIPANRPDRTMQLTVEGTGPVSAKALVEVSNDKKVWFPMYLETQASGANLAGDSWPPATVGWAFVRATVTEITGTNAVASVVMGMV